MEKSTFHYEIKPNLRSYNGIYSIVADWFVNSTIPLDEFIDGLRVLGNNSSFQYSKGSNYRQLSSYIPKFLTTHIDIVHVDDGTSLSLNQILYDSPTQHKKDLFWEYHKRIIDTLSKYAVELESKLNPEKETQNGFITPTQTMWLLSDLELYELSAEWRDSMESNQKL